MAGGVFLCSFGIKEKPIDHYFIKRLSATLFVSKCCSQNKSEILRQTKTPHVVKKKKMIIFIAVGRQLRVYLHSY